MLLPIDQAVVNFIGYHQEVMLLGEFGDLQQGFTAGYSTGGVVGIGKNDSFGFFQ